MLAVYSLPIGANVDVVADLSLVSSVTIELLDDFTGLLVTTSHIAWPYPRGVPPPKVPKGIASRLLGVENGVGADRPMAGSRAGSVVSVLGRPAQAKGVN